MSKRGFTLGKLPNNAAERALYALYTDICRERGEDEAMTALADVFCNAGLRAYGADQFVARALVMLGELPSILADAAATLRKVN